MSVRKSGEERGGKEFGSVGFFAHVEWHVNKITSIETESYLICCVSVAVIGGGFNLHRLNMKVLPPGPQ